MRPFPVAALSAAAALACMIAAPAAGASPADPPDPPIVIDPTNPTGTVGPPSVDISVRDAGGRGRPGAGGGSSHGGERAGRAACRWVPAPDMEQFLRRLPAALSDGP